MSRKDRDLLGLTPQQRRAYLLRLDQPRISDRQAGALMGITRQSFNRLYKTAVQRVAGLRRLVLSVSGDPAPARRLDDYLRRAQMD
ncbi:hypothetical protein [Fontivita pretiosa]|uniref:hypothetical protein n=1 Tax=Fontivita pretiosa TaxID=2989684 RepID=UPI003D181857